jgi:ribosomal protein S18 acetylase RimI-like enzyme
MNEPVQSGLEAGFSIQKATWHDLKQVLALEKLCFSKEDTWPYLDLLAALSFPGLVRYKLSEGQNVIGFVGAEIKEGIGWITTIEVHPDLYGRGFGRALLARAEAALGTPSIRLTTRKSNLKAIRLYEATGYKTAGFWKAYYAGGEDGLVFEKTFDVKNLT